MRSITKLSVNGLIWLLASLAPAQPVLSQDCSCHFDDAQAESCREKCGHHGAHAHGCNDASLDDCQDDLECKHIFVDEPFHCSRLMSLGIRPCQCPSDCNCQLRHEVRIGIISAAKEPTRADNAAAPHQVSASDSARASIATAKPFCTRNSPQKRTALEICAHLCRFAI